MAPSQASEPLFSNSPPQYPFDQVVTHYFSLKGYKYLLYADRYSGWITIVKIGQFEGDITHLKRHLVNLFSTYGTPNEISSDGGPPLNSHEFSTFLNTVICINRDYSTKIILQKAGFHYEI